MYVSCRFVSADGILNNDLLLGTNLFTYCVNNPVNALDFDGCAPETLQEYIKIKQSANDPIKISIKGNDITISVYVNFKNDGRKDQIIEGLQFWSGYYELFGYDAHVMVTVLTSSDSKKQKYVSINFTDGLGVPRVKRTGFLGLWWTKSSPGKMFLYDGDSRNGNQKIFNDSDFRFVVAHEFGHFLGLPDIAKKKNSCISIMNESFSISPQNADMENVLLKFGKRNKK